MMAKKTALKNKFLHGLTAGDLYDGQNKSAFNYDDSFERIAPLLTKQKNLKDMFSKSDALELFSILNLIFKFEQSSDAIKIANDYLESLTTPSDTSVDFIIDFLSKQDDKTLKVRFHDCETDNWGDLKEFIPYNFYQYDYDDIASLLLDKISDADLNIYDEVQDKYSSTKIKLYFSTILFKAEWTLAQDKIINRLSPQQLHEQSILHHFLNHKRSISEIFEVFHALKDEHKFAPNDNGKTILHHVSFADLKPIMDQIPPARWGDVDRYGDYPFCANINLFTDEEFSKIIPHIPRESFKNRLGGLKETLLIKLSYQLNETDRSRYKFYAVASAMNKDDIYLKDNDGHDVFYHLKRNSNLRKNKKEINDIILKLQTIADGRPITIPAPTIVTTHAAPVLTSAPITTQGDATKDQTTMPAPLSPALESIITNLGTPPLPVPAQATPLEIITQIINNPRSYERHAHAFGQHIMDDIERVMTNAMKDSLDQISQRENFVSATHDILAQTKALASLLQEVKNTPTSVPEQPSGLFNRMFAKKEPKRDPIAELKMAIERTQKISIETRENLNNRLDNYEQLSIAIDDIKAPAHDIVDALGQGHNLLNNLENPTRKQLSMAEAFNANKIAIMTGINGLHALQLVGDNVRETTSKTIGDLTKFRALLTQNAVQTVKMVDDFMRASGPQTGEIDAMLASGINDMIGIIKSFETATLNNIQEIKALPAPSELQDNRPVPAAYQNPADWGYAGGIGG